ncbi:hypothetical protein [Sphingomonas alpina]|uniref:LPXTG cell wall anchor domain-containing protein n=1 Tax=Sphingomonas alpina TaxID=653931 RepID=A0A7H0LLD1_9SPHN|nr:hypothetical protein [Sphingomonas alpina]QNQ10484.1 hypothetical protein H3Z74_04490 [Sphingomonas alpina]
MKIMPPQHRRAFAALVPTLVLLAVPAVAQEVQTAPPAQAVAPPPVVPTITATPPAPATVAPPAAQVTTPELAAAEPAAEATAAPVTRRTTRTVRQARTVTRAPAPQRAAPVAAAPAPVAEAAPAITPPASNPEVAPVAEAPVAVAPAPVPEAAAPAADTATTTTTTDAAPVWPWVLAGIAVLAILGALMLRRRRRVEDVYYEETYVEPVAETAPAHVEPVRAEPAIAPAPQFIRVAPLAAAPVAAATADELVDAVAVEAELAEPEAEDVAALTAGTAHADRPWLEFSMRPVRAGSNAEDALVEIELTVGNSGSVAAKDVRISTFMFATESGNEAEMERLLLERSGDGEVSPVTIEPGEGTRVDATLSLSKEVLGEEAKTFVPFVVANARYRLADGSEGRTSASFTIGMNDDGTNDGSGEMRPIAIHRQQMSDNIEARLHGVPQHA